MPTVLVNADDYGLHRDIDAGIEQCIDAGVVQSVSFSPQGQSLNWDRLIDLRCSRGVRVGLHVTLVGEPWLTDGRLIVSWKDIVKALLSFGEKAAAMRRDVEREVDAQVKACLDRHVPLSHIDSHQHVHAFNGVWQPVLKAAQQHGIPRVRVPWCPSWKIIKKNVGGIALQCLSARLSQRVGRFLPILGIANAGHNTFEIYKREFRAVSATGDVELCVHPGNGTPALQKKYLEWNFDWAAERDALLHPRFHKMIESRGFTLAPFLPATAPATIAVA